MRCERVEEGTEGGELVLSSQSLIVLIELLFNTAATHDADHYALFHGTTVRDGNVTVYRIHLVSISTCPQLFVTFAQCKCATCT